MSIAFMIIDVQKGYVKEKGFHEMMERASLFINATSALFREKNLPVIHIQHKEPGFDTLNPDFQVSNEINQSETDIYITKEFGNAFWKTNLDEVLKQHQVDFIIMSGLSAGYCVLATYNGANERGYGVSLLQNGLLARNQSEVDFVSSTRSMIGYQAIQYLLNQSK